MKLYTFGKIAFLSFLLLTAVGGGRTEFELKLNIYIIRLSTIL